MLGGKPQKLRIALWNANGLQNHNDELKLFLIQNKIDVMLISETHFTSRSHFTVPGYDTCLTNHPADKAHGGTAILIKSHIAYVELPNYATPELQATLINAQGPHRNVTIASTYCPPNITSRLSPSRRYFCPLVSAS